jgi:hypothetical protein
MAWFASSKASSTDVAKKLMCPILRPFFGSDLPYKCNLADGIVSIFSHPGGVITDEA